MDDQERRSSMKTLTCSKGFIWKEIQNQEKCMEETMDESEIRRLTGTDASRIKVRYIRDYYLSTKQSLVDVPTDLSIVIFKM